MSKKFCVIAPSKGTGQFLQLKKQLGYKQAWTIYDIITHQDFLEDYKDTLTLDSEGIPTFESIIENPYVKKKIGLSQVQTILQSQYQQRDNTRDNFAVALGEALQFNTSNPERENFVALVRESGEKIRTTIVPRTKETMQEFQDQYGVNTLNQKISEILSPLGITIGQLTEAETLGGRIGHINFANVESLSNDFIRVANNIEGEQALSEEFSHLCIEVFKNTPLVQRSLSQMDEASIKEILGDTYQSQLQYYNNDMNKMAEEALGHLLQTAFFDVTKAPKRKQTLFGRLVNYLKNLFKGIDVNSIKDSIYDAKVNMNNLAKEILNGDREITKQNIRAITRTDDLNALSSQIETAIDILNKATDQEVKMAKIQRNDAAEAFIAQIISFQQEDADTALGICRYLEHCLQELNNLNNQFHLAYDTNQRSKFGYLRKVHNYINLYGKTLDRLRKLLAQAEINDELQLLSRTFIADGIDNNTIKNMVNQAESLSRELISKYQIEATNSFAEFLKPFMGQNITNPFTDGKVQSVESLLQEAKSDITFMDKWLSSMAESSDVLLQLFDQATKKAKDKARLDTIELSKQIQSAYKKALNAGVTDFSFMYRYSNGNRTSQYIGTDSELRTLTDAQREFYNTFINLKSKLDEKLNDPRATTTHVIQIRKEFVGGSLGLLARGKFNEFGESMKNLVFERTYDDQQGFGLRKGMVGFDGREYNLVPKYYISDINNQDEVSDDPVGSLIAYAFMANNFKEMDDIVDALETGRDILKSRSVKETRGDTILKETLQWHGIDVNTEAELQWEKTNIAQKLDLFFNSQVYGKYLKDEGIWKTPFGDLSKSKLTSTILGWSSTVQLGFNWLANTANIANGIAMINIEAAGSRFFKPKSLTKADKLYSQMIGEYISELSSPIKKSKLALIDEYFDVRQDFNEQAKTRYDKALLTKIFGPNIAFIGQGAGDHWLYNRTALAMLLETEVTDREGNESNLYEALEVVTDNNGVARLQIKQGWKVPNTRGKNIFSDLSRRIGSVNQKLFGIYNQDDAVAAQQVSLGRLALQYRKWMIPALNKRFQAAQYNVTLDEWEEGYYRTAGRFILQLAKELRRGKFQLMANYDGMSKEAQANIRRAFTEVSQYLMLIGSIGLLELWSSDDKKKRPWLLKFLEYQLKRQRTELGVLIPGPQMLGEGFKIIDSPAAGLSAVEHLGDLASALIDPMDWVTEKKTGPYKGWTEVEKQIFINTPYAKSIRRATTDIDSALQYFNQ